jgi:hypothetical protein
MRRNPLSTAVGLTLACAAAALALAPSAAADVSVGVADNHPEAPELAQAFYDNMTDVGLRENRLSLLWDSAAPTEIPNESGMHNAIAVAAAHGIHVTLSLYPSRARSVTESPQNAANFVAWTAQVARAFPEVKDFIVGNEPNKARFWQPQFNPNHTRAACASFEPVLAAAYDALKGVDNGITVIGAGLGARGTDNPFASGNLSISPVRCIHDFGVAYRKSKRKRPIMDELSLHAYPNLSTDKLETGYPWPNAGVPNLARVKQAMWDAFFGTAQPTFEEKGMPGGPLRTLKLRLNEIGWQVTIPPANREAYFGKESVVTIDEGTQAAIYGNLIPFLACDPAVKSLLIFQLVDEGNLDRWQSGLVRADWTTRPSYAIVKGSIAAGQTHCAGKQVRWRHEFRPVGVHLGFLGRSRARSNRNKAWSFVAGSEEGATYTAALYPVRGRAFGAGARLQIRRSLATRRMVGAALRSRGVLSGGWDRVINFPSKRVKPGRYVYGARVVAEMNPVRKAVYIGKPFVVKPT